MVVSLSQAIKHLNNEGILIYPTDTVYGIGCLPNAVDKLLEIKPRTSGFIVLVDKFSHYEDWIAEPFSPPKTESPTTWIVKATRIVPKKLQMDGNIAIREVIYPPTLALLKKLSVPLISTSANYPGKPTPTSISELEDIFDLPILEGETGGNKPSKIIHYQSGKIIRR